MKKIEENLTREQFESYCEDVANMMESETTEYGQQDEYIPYYENLQRRHIYGNEKDEHEVVIFEEKYDEKTGENYFDIYEWDE